MIQGTGQLSGKRALVTGASGGLGAHFAGLLAAHGAEVVLAARRVAALDTVVQEIQVEGRISAVALDVTDSASCAKAPHLRTANKTGTQWLTQISGVCFSSPRPWRWNGPAMASGSMRWRQVISKLNSTANSGRPMQDGRS